MKQAMLGLFIVAGLIVATLVGFGLPGSVFAERPPTIAPPGSGDLLVVPIPGGDKGQCLAVVDPKTHVMGVYRIDAVTGKIGLKSVRNLYWDLQMTYHNNEAPLPQEIQTLLEQR